MNVVAAFGIGLYNEYKLIRCSNFHKGVIMEYQVLIFMTEKYLSAVEMVSENDCERISIDGNETVEYKDEKDIRKFCDYIKEYYSIDEFSDLEMEIDLVYGNTEQRYLTHFINLIKGCNKISVIELKKILPVILLQKKMIRKNENVLGAFLGESYQVRCDNAMQITAEKTVVNGIGKQIKYEDFSFLYYFDAKNLSNDISSSKAYKENVLKIDTIKQQLDEKNKQNRLLQEQRDMMSAQVEDANRNINNLQDRIVSYEKTIESLRQEKVKMFLELEPLFEKDRQIISVSFSRSDFFGDFLLKLQVEDGSNIEVGNTIIELEPLDNYMSNNHKEYCRARKSGKIIWLIGKRTQKNRHSSSIDVAVICNKLDNKENVMKWYKRNPEPKNLLEAVGSGYFASELGPNPIRESLWIEKKK